MRHIVLNLIVLAALTYGAAADAQPADAPPVRIEGCSVSGQAVMQNPKIGLRLPRVSGVTIAYVNERDIIATEVHFRVRYQGETGTLVDRGSLAPGKKITREFTTFNAIFNGSGSVDCAVTSVVFADASHWDAPVEAGSDRRR